MVRIDYSKTGIEKELITKNTNYKYQPITTVKFERKKIFKNLHFETFADLITALVRYFA